MSGTKRPGRYLEPDLSKGRDDETWAKIAARVPALRSAQSMGRRARRWIPAPWLFVSATALAVAAALVFRHPGSRERVAEGLSLASEANPRSFELTDGTYVDLDPFASVTIASHDPSEQRVVLTRGAARFRVVHDPARRFIVIVGTVEVLDIGTVFSVAREGEDGELVRVSVAVGDVEVRVSGLARPLHAGESLTTPEAPPVMDVEPPVSRAAQPTPTSSGSVDGPTSSHAVASARASEPVSAKSLLAEATRARQAGDAFAEAQALDALRRRFPRDARTPLATFELGRIQMDQLGNPRGALETLRAAIANGPGASLREDAEARIVALLEQLGDREGCRTARESFLAHYPASAHQASIRNRCQTP